MTDKKLSTEAYKGVRDFYPEDSVVQQHIFNTWAKTAESFGFERYDASILEPADLYKAKGAENEELVNEQTYTFLDRGNREVTLRPEMTPTVARLVAKKARELSFPLRWYSIPNLFRYERPQKGRLREHWQLNCDIFGSDHIAADIEIISLAYQTMINFGATPDMFEIKINDRAMMHRLYTAIGLSEEMVAELTKLNDRKNKISEEDYQTKLNDITKDEVLSEEVNLLLGKSDEQTDVMVGLAELGINNVVFDKTLARGFDYYTGTIFEIFDTSLENNRALIGGGRYDNLTSMFDGDPIPGIGFGMGDVTLRDFLETHDLIPESLFKSSAVLVVIPETAEQNLFAQGIAKRIRLSGHYVYVDIGTQKVDKKKARAKNKGAKYLITFGEAEISSEQFTLKNLETDQENRDNIETIISRLEEVR